MLNRLKTFLFKSDLEYVAEKVSLADVGEGIYISAWHYDIPKPTIAELLKISEKDVALTNYASLRQYPPISEQLDAMWKGGEALETMRETILSIKEKYPKK